MARNAVGCLKLVNYEISHALHQGAVDATAIVFHRVAGQRRRLGLALAVPGSGDNGSSNIVPHVIVSAVPVTRQRGCDRIMIKKFNSKSFVYLSRGRVQWLMHCAKIAGHWDGYHFWKAVLEEKDSAAPLPHPGTAGDEQRNR